MTKKFSAYVKTTCWWNSTGLWGCELLKLGLGQLAPIIGCNIISSLTPGSGTYLNPVIRADCLRSVTDANATWNYKAGRHSAKLITCIYLFFFRFKYRLTIQTGFLENRTTLMRIASQWFNRGMMGGMMPRVVLATHTSVKSRDRLPSAKWWSRAPSANDDLGPYF